MWPPKYRSRDSRTKSPVSYSCYKPLVFGQFKDGSMDRTGVFASKCLRAFVMRVHGCCLRVAAWAHSKGCWLTVHR